MLCRQDVTDDVLCLPFIHPRAPNLISLPPVCRYHACMISSFVRAVPSIYSSASPMGRKSALRREIAWILRRFQRRLSC